MHRLLLAAPLLVFAACSAGAPATRSDGTLVGTITTEGNVTTVVNESGSVINVYGADGEILDPWPLTSSRWSINGPMVVGVAQDEAGTLMVKWYRLLLPGEE